MAALRGQAVVISDGEDDTDVPVAAVAVATRLLHPEPGACTGSSLQVRRGAVAAVAASVTRLRHPEPGAWKGSKLQKTHLKFARSQKKLRSRDEDRTKFADVVPLLKGKGRRSHAAQKRPKSQTQLQAQLTTCAEIAAGTRKRRNTHRETLVERDIDTAWDSHNLLRAGFRGEGGRGLVK